MYYGALKLKQLEKKSIFSLVLDSQAVQPGPRGVLLSPPLEIFKTQVGKALEQTLTAVVHH